MIPSVKILILAGVSCVLLSGCESAQNPFSDMKWPNWSMGKSDKPTANCPTVGMMQDLGSVTDIRGTETVTNTNLTSLTSTCDTKDGNSTVRLNLGFNSKLGPAGIKDAKVQANYSIPYLIAVINPKGDIISKDVFTISLTFKDGVQELANTDVLEQIIPIEAATKPKDYKILVGFQLSEQQLAFNRAKSAMANSQTTAK